MVGNDESAVVGAAAAAILNGTPIDWPALEARVSEVIAQEFGLDVPALALSEAEMRRVVGGNPFADEAAADPTRVHAMFVSPMPDQSALDGVDPSDYQPDEFALGPGVVYLHLPHGLGRAKLPEVIGRRFKASTVTTRRRFSLSVPVLSKQTTSTRLRASIERGARTRVERLVSRRADAT